MNKLLDKLETDNAFRASFTESPEKALRSLGYVDPWQCMTLNAGAKLASVEQIKAQRHKLEDSLVSVQQYMCPLESQEGF